MYAPALWVHFNKFGAVIAYIVRYDGGRGQFLFEAVEKEDKFMAHNYQSLGVATCVVDGVTKDNLKEVGRSWRVFGGNPSSYVNCNMVWVSSQQIPAPLEQLEALNMSIFNFYSWSQEEIRRFAFSFNKGEKAEFIADVERSTPKHRVAPNAAMDFELALRIKMYYFGSSARWVFGMAMTTAMDDIQRQLEKVQDASKLQAGLSGSRGDAAVNHLIAMYKCNNPEKPREFRIGSDFVVESLSETVGLNAIRAMYASSWVRKNPSVHGFVFEWDILTRLRNFKTLSVFDSARRAYGQQ